MPNLPEKMKSESGGSHPAASPTEKKAIPGVHWAATPVWGVASSRLYGRDGVLAYALLRSEVR